MGLPTLSQCSWLVELVPLLMLLTCCERVTSLSLSRVLPTSLSTSSIRVGSLFYNICRFLLWEILNAQFPSCFLVYFAVNVLGNRDCLLRGPITTTTSTTTPLSFGSAAWIFFLLLVYYVLFKPLIYVHLGLTLAVLALLTNHSFEECLCAVADVGCFFSVGVNVIWQ